MAFPALLLFASLGASRSASPLLGEDLARWHQIDLLTAQDSERVSAYRQFIVRFPTSALSENAWAQLQRLDGLDGAWTAGHEATLRRIEHSWRTHHAALSSQLEHVAVAPLNGDGQPLTQPPSQWTVSTQLGGGWSGGAQSHLGLRASYGRVGLIGRAGRDDRLFAQTGLRVSGGLWGPYLEALVRTDGALSALVGGRLQILGRPWLEGAVGLSVNEKRLRPVITVDLSRTLWR